MCTQDACHSCRHRYLYHFRCIWISEFWPAVPLVQFLKCRHGVHRRRRPWVSESALGLGCPKEWQEPWTERIFPRVLGWEFAFPSLGGCSTFPSPTISVLLANFSSTSPGCVLWVDISVDGLFKLTKKELSSGDQTRQSTTYLDI